MERQPYDAAYKYLFSSRRIVCQLLHSFVKDLELIEKSFVSEELVRREADLVFKVNLKGRDAAPGAASVDLQRQEELECPFQAGGDD